MSDLRELPHALRELQRRESELQAAEDEKKRIEHEKAEAARVKTEALGEAQAGSILAGLRPLYQARAKQAEELIPALSAFWTTESAIRKAEAEAYEILRATQRFNDSSPQERFNSAHLTAGLPNHKDLGIRPPSDSGETLAETVMAAIAAGYLEPGAIVIAGGKGVSFNFHRR